MSAAGRTLSRRAVSIDYTNWRGERAWRWIEPEHLRFGTSEHHGDPQWLLEAVDVAKGEPRTFALRNIHAWKSVGS